jgi:hypothetical protein
MSPSYVLKFRLGDSKDAAILIHVTPKGNADLDLDLLGTDGDAAFRGKGEVPGGVRFVNAANASKVRARSLDKLRAKNYDGSTEEWTSIIRYGLVSRQSDIDQAVRDNLEVSCDITGKDPKAALSLTFRTRVQDITQRLGSIELQQTADTDDVDLFGWAMQLADRRDELEAEASKQQTKAGAEAETIQALQDQLRQLTTAKADHEEELVSKFAYLLNEKKHQLRKIQRVLETAQVDPSKLKDLEQSTASGSKRGQKRSARQTIEADESDESDAFDDMDVDKPARAQVTDDDEDGGQQTTDTEETEDENDNLDQPVTSQTEAESADPAKQNARGKAPQHMPAPRELPFSKKGSAPSNEPPKASTPEIQASKDDDEETASEDDEL